MSNITNFNEFRIGKFEKIIFPIPLVNMIKEELTEEDYIDFLLGCIDHNHYNGLDVDLQDLVDAYHNEVGSI